MTKQTFEFGGASIDASAPVVVDYAAKSSSWIMGNTVETRISIYCGKQNKEVMRITADGVWVDPDMTTNEAAKAVIAALDEHIKHVFAKKDAAMQMALEALWTTANPKAEAAIKALEDALK